MSKQCLALLEKSTLLLRHLRRLILSDAHQRWRAAQTESKFIGSLAHKSYFIPSFYLLVWLLLALAQELYQFVSDVCLRYLILFCHVKFNNVNQFLILSL